MRTHVRSSRVVIAREGGRPSIPEKPMIERRDRGVLDHPHARVMTTSATGEALPPRRLRRLPPPVGGRLIGHARVVRAVGQARERLAAAEEEVRACGIADRPVAGGFVEFQKRQPLAHRHDVVIGDRIGLDLDFKGLRERSVATRHWAQHPHHLRGARLARPRRGGGGGFRAAGKAQAMHLADHGIAGHVAEFRRDLARGQSGFPELLQLLDALIGPGQYRHRILPFASRRPSRGGAGDAKPPKSLRAESLSPRRARLIRARTFTPHKRYLGVIFAARDVVPDERNATICRDSGARVGRLAFHMFRLEFTTFPESYGCGLPDSYGWGPFRTARTATWRVDSDRLAPKIVPVCRLQKAAHFVFRRPSRCDRTKC